MSKRFMSSDLDKLPMTPRVFLGTLQSLQYSRFLYIFKKNVIFSKNHTGRASHAHPFDQNRRVLLQGSGRKH